MLNKEIFVSISGLQMDIDAEDALEVISPGEYYFKNNKHFIFYEELTEMEDNTHSISKNRLVLSNDTIELSKKGANNVNLVFSLGKETMNCYNTPFGALMVGILTKDIKIKELDAGVVALIDYSLDINYSHVSDCEITIKIINRKGE